MNQEVSSVQAIVRDGEKHDIYYYSKHNMFVQARPTLSNNKFTQQLVSPNVGTSQFIFSPDQGLSDVIMVVALKAEGEQGAAYANYGLNRGWGYSLINNIAVRYGGSSQYFFSGNQMLLQNLMDMQDAVSRDKLFDLGGQATLGASPSGNQFARKQVAYIYINLPHNTPNGDGLKMAPLPTELLRQPVLIQVTLNDARSIFSSNNTAVSQALPFDPVAEAYFQCRQVRMINSEDLLTNEEDPMKITYTYPLKYFPQQEYTLSIQETNPNQKAQVNLTGFRNGSVRSIVLWLTKDSNTPAPSGAGARAFNPNVMYAPQNIVLSINGEIFYNAKYSSSLLLDLVNNKQPNEVAMTLMNTGPALTFAATGIEGQYVKVDFAQHADPVTSSNLLVAGKSITNSIVNLEFSVPPQTPAGASRFTLHALYLYNSSLIFAGGNCEYSF